MLGRPLLRGGGKGRSFVIAAERWRDSRMYSQYGFRVDGGQGAVVDWRHLYTKSSTPASREDTPENLQGVLTYVVWDKGIGMSHGGRNM